MPLRHTKHSTLPALEEEFQGLSVELDRVSRELSRLRREGDRHGIVSSGSLPGQSGVDARTTHTRFEVHPGPGIHIPSGQELLGESRFTFLAVAEPLGVV